MKGFIKLDKQYTLDMLNQFGAHTGAYSVPMVWLYLMMSATYYGTDKGQVHKSVVEMSKESGISEHTFRRALRDLEFHGYIKVIYRPYTRITILQYDEIVNGKAE